MALALRAPLLRITMLLRKGHIRKNEQRRRFTRSLLPTPSHRAASAAKGKGSAGPVRRRRKTGTLYVIPRLDRPVQGQVWKNWL